MTRFFIATVIALASLPAFQPSCAVNAVAIAPNQFEDPPLLQPKDRERISAGHHTDSPFGSGCVGTNNLCALALSRADDTERETLHRDAPPLLWKVREDEDFQSQLQLSGPSRRLRQFYQRLGGDNYDFKRQLSEAELQRLLEQFEEEGEVDRQNKINAGSELRREMEASRLWRNRFRKVKPERHPSRRIAVASNPSKLQSTFSFQSDRDPGQKTSQHQSAGPAQPGRQSPFMRKRSMPPSSPDDSAGPLDTVSQAQAEQDAFQATLKRQFSRPWSPHDGHK